MPNQKWIVENVNPYYDLLIEGEKRGRHIFWANFPIPQMDKIDITGKMNFESKVQPLLDFHKIENFDYKGDQRKLKILRNLVDYEVGRTIFEAALNIPKKKAIGSLFDEQFLEL